VPNPFVPNQLFPDQSNPFAAAAPTPADAYTSNANAYQGWLAQQRASGVASGMLDPQTGWPTQNALIDAAKQYSGSLMASTAAPTSIASRIATYASKMGYAVDRDSSKISGSEYLNLTHDALPDTTLKVRVASHDLPGQYGSPGDYDVHAGQPRDFSVGWSDTVKSLADRLGIAPPSAASIAADTKAAKANSFDGQMAVLKQAYPGQVNARTMNDLATQYEAANPGKVNWTPHFRLNPPDAQAGAVNGTGQPAQQE
jgi:hypothetical protein